MSYFFLKLEAKPKRSKAEAIIKMNTVGVVDPVTGTPPLPVAGDAEVPVPPVPADAVEGAGDAVFPVPPVPPVVVIVKVELAFSNFPVTGSSPVTVIVSDPTGRSTLSA